jgi:hypothetical protein
MFNKTVHYFKELLQKKHFHWFVFTLTLVVFIYNSLNYKFLEDDIYFLESTANRSVIQSFWFFYANLNGRWFSNLLNSLLFGSLGNNPLHYWLIHILQFFLFIFSVSYFFKSIFCYFLNIRRSFFQFVSYGAFFTSIFYWFFFDARIEVWYWESSCTVHLISLILIFTIYGLVYEQAISQTLKYLLIIFLCLLMGNNSETFSVACILLSTYIAILNRKKREFFYLHITITFFIGISLLSNVLAVSTSHRKNNLLDSTIYNGVKYGIYTIYLQLQKVKHIPFKIAAVILLVGLSSIIRKDFNLQKPFIPKLLLSAKLLIVLIIIESLFFPAYSITQETPDRTLSFIYLLFLLLGINYSIKKMLDRNSFAKS